MAPRVVYVRDCGSDAGWRLPAVNYQSCWVLRAIHSNPIPRPRYCRARYWTFSGHHHTAQHLYSPKEVRSLWPLYKCCTFVTDVPAETNIQRGRLSNPVACRVRCRRRFPEQLWYKNMLYCNIASLQCVLVNVDVLKLARGCHHCQGAYTTRTRKGSGRRSKLPWQTPRV